MAGWTSPQNRVKENPTDAKKFAALLRLELTAKNGISLQKMRTAYMIQCVVDLLSSTASTSLSQLWVALKSSPVVAKLQLMDCCCVSGPEGMCGAWTLAMETLKTNGDVDVADVFTQCDIQPFTEAGQTLLQGSTSTSKITGGSDEEDEGVDMLSVQELLNFGSGPLVPPADVLANLRHEVQQQLVDHARTVR